MWRSKDDGTPLHKACAGNQVTEVCRLVYNCGHMVNVQNNDGNTPLHLACYYGHSDIVETLMLAGADENIINDHRETAAQVIERRYSNNELTAEERELILQLLNRDILWQVWLCRRRLQRLRGAVLVDTADDEQANDVSEKVETGGNDGTHFADID